LLYAVFIREWLESV